MAQIEFLRHMSLVSLIVLILCSTPPIFATKNCDFPAIFNFGASNSDTGGLAAAFQALPLPNGETFFNRSTGRFSDGRIILDFIGNIIIFLSFQVHFL
ncbi:GDSL-like lipase/acylhydrolase [Medicago truncatula]|uniref:GDSL-like lipase/acylhydrolase n=1 Tax=Medicago truncatula TaxID=3880 RepID=A0A072VFF4_MEDTR|nr:GDSL-like lipase/acylhydrolase [Medicago truncatula]